MNKTAKIILAGAVLSLLLGLWALSRRRTASARSKQATKEEYRYE